LCILFIQYVLWDSPILHLVAIFPSFSSLYNIPLYKYVPQFTYLFHWWWDFVFSVQLLQLMIQWAFLFVSLVFIHICNSWEGIYYHLLFVWPATVPKSRWNPNPYCETRRRGTLGDNEVAKVEPSINGMREMILDHVRIQ
jgi:hypothetical protein